MAGAEVVQFANGLEPFEGNGVKPGFHARFVSRVLMPCALAALDLRIFYSIP